MNTYQEFLASKAIVAPTVGREVAIADIHQSLFPFQRDLVYWAARKGRSAIFADTGLGKTFMQLEWARLVADRCLILAPLAVAQQTVAEAAHWGIPAVYARSQDKAAEHGITVTNYEMLKHFDASYFGAVVLDESSILKSFEGKTRTELINTFADTPYRLCCTATPAPNDISEIANHAEFLGLMSRAEMLAAFFVHDDEGWRLKGHASHGPFYKWLASWSMAIRKPSNLGYSDDGYDLPALSIKPVIVHSDYVPEGMLFHVKLHGIQDRAKVRKSTLGARVSAALDLVNAEPDNQWIAWCGLNDEQDAIELALGDKCVSIYGSLTPDQKLARLAQWISGEKQVLITKPSVFGFGMNFQNCARMIFVGLSDSYEQYYQAIRRCYRFGQQRPVNAYIVLSDIEEAIYDNVLGKEREADAMSAQLIQHVSEFEKQEIGHMDKKFDYNTDEKQGDNWRMLLGDSSERLKELADHSVDLSVFSPPFQSLYTYSPTERDLGNSKSPDEFWGHFSFISSELLRVMKPGRNVCVHVQQITTQKAKDGVIGLTDFRGATIAHFQQAGFVYHGEVCIDKDPQAQAIRTHSKALLFAQMHKDSLWSRPALADYIIIFRVPGDSSVPVVPDLTNNEWIEWARPIWYGISESDTLNAAAGRSDDDERHIAPLQLGTIERCVRLWSNPGETVLSPFGGIGSEGYESVRLGRKYIGIELKPEYFEQAIKNLNKAEHNKQQRTLFDLVDDMQETAIES